jgi:hypothetical protein
VWRCGQAAPQLVMIQHVGAESGSCSRLKCVTAVSDAARALTSPAHSLPTSAPGSAPPLICRLAPAIPPHQRAAFFQAAVAGLAPGSPPPVQIGACRALATVSGTACGVDGGLDLHVLKP